MKNIFKYGINSNMLKTIAIIAMVIDHIGFYFSSSLPTSVYVVYRAVGRIAMPIFVYLLVQGFFHTKNFKRYILRIAGVAIVTQLLITMLMFINIKLVPTYTSAKQLYTTGNILFSFAISLATLKILHEDVLVKKWNNNKNLSLKIILVAVAFIASIFIPIDYGKEVFVLTILMYYIEKFRVKILIEKSKGSASIKNIILNIVDYNKLKLIYLALILLAISSLIVYFNAYWTVILSIVPIALYNGERGKINMKYAYYITFTLQHILLYLVAMAMTLT